VSVDTNVPLLQIRTLRPRENTAILAMKRTQSYLLEGLGGSGTLIVVVVSWASKCPYSSNLYITYV
jgi:hypothetical protein